MTLYWLAESERAVPEGTGWLGPWEAERLARARYTKRRVEFLTSRLAAKRAILAVLGGPAAPLSSVEIRHQPGGAPLPLVRGEPAGVSISMTDRAGWAVCVVTREPITVGCDLELVEPRTPAFVADYLTPAEQALVAAAEGDEQHQVLANLVWSAKESALKVLRTGLRRDTRSVEVTLDGNTVAAGAWEPLEVRAAEGVTFPGWWTRFGQFLLTIAADQALPAPTALADPNRLAGAAPIHSWLDTPLT